MSRKSVVLFQLLSACLVLVLSQPALAKEDPLPSWNSGSTKQSIIDFVSSTCKSDSPSFVPKPERIAVFDNDGTLWAEQPIYTQVVFALERVKALAPRHPEWQTTEPFATVLSGDREKLAALSEKDLIEILMATHAGMTTSDFSQEVSSWIATARESRFKRLYTEMIYQPMVELLAYLRANDYKTYIVSGGGVEFMRPWTETAYGVPPEQVVGSTIKTEFDMRADGPVLMRLPAVDFVDDKVGKPIAINKIIGRVPVFAFGNSDGDLQMLQWTAARKGPHFMALVHHTDAVREWAYDRNSKVGTLDKALDAATQQKWCVVDMKNDWKQIFPTQHK